FYRPLRGGLLNQNPGLKPQAQSFSRFGTTNRSNNLSPSPRQSYSLQELRSVCLSVHRKRTRRSGFGLEPEGDFGYGEHPSLPLRPDPQRLTNRQILPHRIQV